MAGKGGVKGVRGIGGKGGRKAGTPNGDRKTFLDKLAELKCDPIALAVRIANGEHLFEVWNKETCQLEKVPAEPAIVAKMIAVLIDKAVPTPKAVELSNPPGEEFVIRIERE